MAMKLMSMAPTRVRTASCSAAQFSKHAGLPKVCVRGAEPKYSGLSQPLTSRKHAPAASDGLFVVFVGQLAYSVTSRELTEHLEAGGVEGVQVPLFIAACKNYCEVLHIIGPFTMLTVREVNANMAKIETSLQLDAVAYRSMRALLTAEVDAGSPVV